MDDKLLILETRTGTAGGQVRARQRSQQPHRLRVLQGRIVARRRRTGVPQGHQRRRSLRHERILLHGFDTASAPRSTASRSIGGARRRGSSSPEPGRGATTRLADGGLQFEADLEIRGLRHCFCNRTVALRPVGPDICSTRRATAVLRPVVLTKNTSGGETNRARAGTPDASGRRARSCRAATPENLQGNVIVLNVIGFRGCSITSW